MKLYAPCFECHFDDDIVLGEQREKEVAIPWIEAEVSSDLLMTIHCPKEHISILSLSNYIFDALYTSGVSAYLDGYYSESTMSFAAALERTYEHFIKITLFKEGITFPEIDNFWKELSHQSERQYGSFCSQYLKITKKAWKADSYFIGFRNSVIHKGHISTSLEAEKYANYITDCMYKVLKVIHTEYKKEKEDFWFYEKSKVQKEIEKRQNDLKAVKIIYGGLPLFFWEVQQFEETVNFSNVIENHKSIKKKYGWE